MSVLRAIPAVAAAAGMVVVLATASTWGAARQSTPDPDPAPVAASPFDLEPVLAGDDEPAPVAGGESSASPSATGSAGEVSGIHSSPGLVTEYRVPETTAHLVSAINAYRIAHGLPAFLTSSSVSNCTWGPGGTLFPVSIPTTESLVHGLIRLMNGAVLFRGAPGTQTAAIITADTFIDEYGVAHPGQGASLFVLTCIGAGAPDPGDPGAGPSSPSPSPTPAPSDPPVEPSPPADPSPPSDPPPSDPSPSPTP